jgi:hypothetical protein
VPFANQPSADRDHRIGVLSLSRGPTLARFRQKSLARGSSGGFAAQLSQYFLDAAVYALKFATGHEVGEPSPDVRSAVTTWLRHSTHMLAYVPTNLSFGTL